MKIPAIIAITKRSSGLWRKSDLESKMLAFIFISNAFAVASFDKSSLGVANYPDTLKGKLADTFWVQVGIYALHGSGG